jgi:hypothetical protein
MRVICCFTVCFLFCASNLFSQSRPDTLSYKPFIWKSEPPIDCPFAFIEFRWSDHLKYTDYNAEKFLFTKPNRILDFKIVQL